MSDPSSNERVQEGPRVTVDKSCRGCRWHQQERYQVQGDSGYDHYCTHGGGKRDTGSYTGKMPEWCPFDRPSVEPSTDQSDIDFLAATLVDQESVLDECEKLLKESLAEDGVECGFDRRLEQYWQKRKALADWRSRELRLVQPPTAQRFSEAERRVPEEERPAETTLLRADLGNCGEPGSFEQRMETFERVATSGFARYEGGAMKQQQSSKEQLSQKLRAVYDRLWINDEVMQPSDAETIMDAVRYLCATVEPRAEGRSDE